MLTSLGGQVGSLGSRAQVCNDRFIDSGLSTVDSRTVAEHDIAPGAACPVASAAEIYPHGAEPLLTLTAEEATALARFRL